jgi:hypothetical protein
VPYLARLWEEGEEDGDAEHQHSRVLPHLPQGGERIHLGFNKKKHVRKQFVKPKIIMLPTVF